MIGLLGCYWFLERTIWSEAGSACWISIRRIAVAGYGGGTEPGCRDMPDPGLRVLRVLLLLGIANTVPILATRLLGGRFGTPLDGGLVLPDGQPLFGASKTIRGLVLSIPLTAAIAVLIGFDWMTGAGLAAALHGRGSPLEFRQAAASGMPLHGQAFGLDQIPEALLPMLLFRPASS